MTRSRVGQPRLRVLCIGFGLLRGLCAPDRPRPAETRAAVGGGFRTASLGWSTPARDLRCGGSRPSPAIESSRPTCIELGMTDSLGFARSVGFCPRAKLRRGDAETGVEEARPGSVVLQEEVEGGRFERAARAAFTRARRSRRAR